MAQGGNCPGAYFKDASNTPYIHEKAWLNVNAL
jgi:hypothetical protein